MKKLLFLAACAAMAIMTGCATSDSAQPAKSQTQRNTFDDCVFIMAAKATVSNGVIRAEESSTTPLEMFTQTQALESSGTESFAQTATQTPTNDVKPDTTLTLTTTKGVKAAEAAKAAAGSDCPDGDCADK